MEMMKYTRPTPIQAYTIPALLLGNDVIAIAQTGQYSPLFIFQVHFTNTP